MFSSIFPSVYSIFSSYNERPLESSVAKMKTEDRESLAHDVASGMRTIPSPPAASVSAGENDVEEDVDTNTHSDLAHHATDDDEVESSLAELNVALDQCRTSLASFEKKERFLGIRIARYRQLMEQREHHIHELRLKCHNEEDDDFENKNDLDVEKHSSSLQSKHERDRESLRSVEGMHRDMIAETELLRRRIDDLEEKQQEILEKREECREFLIATSEIVS